MATPLVDKSTEHSELKPVPTTGRNGVLEVLAMRRDPFRFAAERRAEYGDVFSMNAFGIKMVSTAGADAAQQILINKDQAFANAPAWSFFIGPFFNRGVMLLDFDEHKHHRRIMQEAFTPKILRGYFEEMQPVIADRVAKWPTGKVLMMDQLKQLTLDVAAEIFLGVDLTPAEAKRLNKAFIETVRAGVALVRKPVPGGRWWKGIRSRKVLEEFFYEHIDAKRATQTPDLFSVLCHAQDEHGNRFTDDDVVNHMIFVLMAAHDTSTITLTQMVYRMAEYPEWQDKARAQSLELPDMIDYDQLSEMTVVEHIMDESLRMCPPVPAQPRMAIKDTQVLGHFIPKGTMVVIPQMSNHRDNKYFANPDVFDPDRFAPPRQEQRSHRMAWMPFGGGVHKCIGLYFGQMEIKTIMHHLLRDFEWSVPDGYVMPMDYSALPVPKDRLPVNLVRR